LGIRSIRRFCRGWATPPASSAIICCWLQAARPFPLPKPEERWPWHYTATHRDLLEKADAYEALPDDGELKFFCVGVHSIDYEKVEKWDDLRTFAARFGKNPSYWSAPVGEIFGYADALSQLRQENGCLENPTDITLYVRVNGENVILAPHGKINL